MIEDFMMYVTNQTKLNDTNQGGFLQ